MKRFFWRELGLVGAPLLVVGALLGWAHWQKRLRTPRVALSVQFSQSQVADTSAFWQNPNGKIKFGWVADLRGGPLPGYRFGWNERLIAQTRRGPIVVWELKTPPKAWQTNAAGGSFVTPPAYKTNAWGGTYCTTAISGTFSSAQSLNHCSHSRRYEIPENTLPADTQSLEWYGEMAAIPADDADIWQSPLSHQQIQNWAYLKGMATWKRMVRLPYNPQKFSPLVLRSQKVIQWKAAVVRVEIYSRRGNKRSFERLVAFDGKTRRVLWRGDKTFNRFLTLTAGGSYRPDERETVSFDLNTVPASWGEVSFLCDTVFDLSGRALIVSSSNMKLSESTLNVFQKQTGGFRASRSLVLRPRLGSQAKKSSR